MKNTEDQILDHFPIQGSFLLVDRIDSFRDGEIQGHYTFRPDLEVYGDHFVGNPVTPGSLLQECCAQIGLLAYGIGLYLKETKVIISGRVARKTGFALVAAHMEFLAPVFPGTRVSVRAVNTLNRFGRIRMEVVMRDEENTVVCKGTLEGQSNVI